MSTPPIARCGKCRTDYEVPREHMLEMRAEWDRFPDVYPRGASDQQIVDVLHPNLCERCCELVPLPTKGTP